MKRLIISLLLLAAVCSCAKEGMETAIVSPNDKVPVTITASGLEVDTKVQFEETGTSRIDLRPKWEVGDEVFGFGDGSLSSNRYTFTVQSVDSEGVAILSGEAPANCTLHLVFCNGKSATDFNSGNELSLSFQYQNGSAASLPAPMVSKGQIIDGSGHFTFENLCSIIVIRKANGVPAGKTIQTATVGGTDLSLGTVRMNGSKLDIVSSHVYEYDDFVSCRSVNATVGSDGTLSNPIFIAVPKGSKVECVDFKIPTGSSDPNLKYDTYRYLLSSSKSIGVSRYFAVNGQTFVKKDGIQLWPAGPFWKETNLGAGSCYDAGSFYSWGNNVPCTPQSIDWDNPYGIYPLNAEYYNCRWLSQYGYLDQFGFDGFSALLYNDVSLSGTGTLVGSGHPWNASQNDAARITYGGSWRLPELVEFRILSNEDHSARLSYSATAPTTSHVYGYSKFTGNLDECQGCNIILPAGGGAVNNTIADPSFIGYYWSSDAYDNSTGSEARAYRMDASSLARTVMPDPVNFGGNFYTQAQILAAFGSYFTFDTYARASTTAASRFWAHSIRACQD